MKGLKLDTNKLLGGTAGNAAALLAHTGLNRIPFVKNQSPLIRGLATVAIARFAIPMVAGMANLNKGKGQSFTTGAEEGLATLGLAQVGNKYAPNLFPTISGYEDSPVAGLAIVTEEEPIEGLDEEPIEGAEEEEVQGTGDGVYA